MPWARHSDELATRESQTCYYLHFYYLICLKHLFFLQLLDIINCMKAKKLVFELPDHKQDLIRRIVITVLVFVVLFIFAFNIKNFYRVWNMYTYDRYLSSLYDLKQQQGLSALKEINSACVAYVEIEDLDMHLPIVEVKSTTEENFYLNHDFRKWSNELGSPYQKFGTKIGQTTNTVLVGHSAFNETVFQSTKNQTIFGKLNDYVYDNPTFNYIVTLETFEQIHTYHIISIMRFNVKNGNAAQELEVFNTKDITSEAKFNTFYNTIKSKTLIGGLPTAEYGDKFLSFFTCSTTNLDYRIIVCVRISHHINYVSRSVKSGAPLSF